MLAENYTDIPVVIDGFEGGDGLSPNVMLSISDLDRIGAVANVTAIRIPELISWYMERHVNNPVAWIGWVHSIFDYALSNNLKIYWSEWKLGPDIEALTNTTLAGYEGKITYLYQTNNEYQHPLIGFEYATRFPHWGASVQSWFVDKKTGEDRWDMPVDTIREYALLARNVGAEVIEFEPYWYFFDNNGEPMEPIYAIWSIV